MVTAGAGLEAGLHVRRVPAPGRHQLQIPDSSSRKGRRIVLTVQGVLLLRKHGATQHSQGSTNKGKGGMTPHQDASALRFGGEAVRPNASQIGLVSAQLYGIAGQVLISQL